MRKQVQLSRGGGFSGKLVVVRAFFAKTNIWLRSERFARNCAQLFSLFRIVYADLLESVACSIKKKYTH